MTKIDVKIDARSGNYSIYIGEDNLYEIDTMIDFSKYSNIFILTDEKIQRLYQHTINKIFENKSIKVFAVKEGEISKSLEVYAQIIGQLVEFKFDRKALMVNIGGGMITDLGGFVASTYQRGIDFINISTSIEGMVDASVGGKNGINFGNYKNYIGTFNQPNAVIIDVKTLETLDDRNFTAGWSEIIKHGLIYDKSYFKKVTSRKPREFINSELIEIIAGSCEIKKSVVEADEKEGGVRKILNFGHTIGHAIESISFDYERLLHGEAIAIGMVAEAYISYKLDYISLSDFNNIKNSIFNAGLPIQIPFELDGKVELNELIKKDKKNFDGKIKWTLIKNIGNCLFDIEVDDKIIDDALNQIL
jgi:3-dehydroquinate synthase